MLDSGDCTCYGSCELNASKYEGECLMKPESTTEIETIQPRFVSSDRCGTCENIFSAKYYRWDFLELFLYLLLQCSPYRRV